MFKKITKKQFIEDMTSSSVILVWGGYTTEDLQNKPFVKKIIDVCESFDIDNAEQCRCVAHSNSLERIFPNGDSSWLYFDQRCKRCFYEYGNIRIMESTYNDGDKKGYVIYLCV